MSEQPSRASDSNQSSQETPALRIPQAIWFDALASNHPSRWIKPRRWIEIAGNVRIVSPSSRRCQRTMVRETICMGLLVALLCFNVLAIALVTAALASSFVIPPGWIRATVPANFISVANFFALVIALACGMPIVARWILMQAVLMILGTFLAGGAFLAMALDDTLFLFSFPSVEFVPLAAFVLLAPPLALRWLRWSIGRKPILRRKMTGVSDMLMLTTLIAVAVAIARLNRLREGDDAVPPTELMQGMSIALAMLVGVFIFTSPLLGLLRIPSLLYGVLLAMGYIGLLGGTALAIVYFDPVWLAAFDTESTISMLLFGFVYLINASMLLMLLRASGYRIRRQSTVLAE